MEKRKHHKLIKAWADGADVQIKQYVEAQDEFCWKDEPLPTWDASTTYRIKPTLITMTFKLDVDTLIISKEKVRNLIINSLAHEKFPTIRLGIYNTHWQE